MLYPYQPSGKKKTYYLQKGLLNACLIAAFARYPEQHGEYRRGDSHSLKHFIFYSQ